MPRLTEYCITCGGKFRVIVSFVVEKHYELLGLDLDTMHCKANPEKIIEQTHAPSYSILCERCHDSQPVTIEFSEPTTGGHQ
jgi:hypothetical protein